MNKELQEKINSILMSIDDVKNELDDLEFDVEQLENSLQHTSVESIYDINEFIRRLKYTNLYTPEFEKFLDEYLKYYNK